MKKFSDFMIEKRFYIVAVMLILAIISAFMIPHVEVNHDMTKYLPDDSPMKEGIEIMDTEFPGVRDRGAVQVMFTDLDDEEKLTVKAQLEGLANVDSVTYDNSESYNKDNHTLYVVNCPYKYDSPEEKQLEKDIKTLFHDKDIVLQHTLATALTIPFWVYIIVAVVLIAILFLMCSSYFEPFLFIITIGIAILINLGTNLMFGSVSDSTFSLSSILQLVLSMDYSIILMNRYRQEKDKGLSAKQAMKNAYALAFPSVISSCVTTVVGLIMLVLMRFKIGLDLGLVMAKGVAISMICVLTILPTLILLSDKLIEKTKKKEMPVKTKPIAKFTFKARNVLTICFGVLFLAVFFLQGITTTTFAQPRDNKINNVFNPPNQVIVLYENKDEENIKNIASEIEGNDKVNSVLTFSTTLGKELTSEEMSQAISAMVNIDGGKTFTDLLYYNYYKGEEPLPAVTLVQLIETIDNPVLSGILPESIKSQISLIKPLANKEFLTTPVPYQNMAVVLGVPETACQQLYTFYFNSKGLEITDPMLIAPHDLLTFLVNDIFSNETLKGIIISNPELGITEEKISNITQSKLIADLVVAETRLPVSLALPVIQSIEPTVTESQVKLLYMLSASINSYDSTWKLSMETFLHYLATDIVTDENFAPFINEQLKNTIIGADGAMDGIKSNIVGENHSIMLIDVKLPEESKETTEFINNLNTTLSENIGNKFYIIGNSPMNVEMEKGFGRDQLLITALSTLAIFIVVALTFRSLLIPLTLVLIVQCGVCLTVVINGILGQNIYYMSLLVVQCILIGATIDYGIVFTNYYLENRQKYDVLKSLENAFSQSIHTILTSSLIIILITGIIGFCPADPAITKICLTISIGTLCVALFIIFILPGILACFDKVLTTRKKPNKNKHGKDKITTDSDTEEDTNSETVSETVPETVSKEKADNTAE